SLIGVLLVPIIVRVFTVAEYGIVDGIRVFSSFSLILTLLAMDSATALFMSTYSDIEIKRRIAGQGLASVLLTSTFGAGVIVACAPVINRAIFGEATDMLNLSMRIAGATVPLVAIVVFGQGLLKWHFRRKSFVFLSVFHTVAVLVLTVLATAFLRLGIP